MGKLDDTNDEMRNSGENADTDKGPEAEDTEGHMFLPHDPGTARAMAGDRMRDTERRARDRNLEREAREYKEGRTNRR